MCMAHFCPHLGTFAAWAHLSLLDTVFEPLLDGFFVCPRSGTFAAQAHLSLLDTVFEPLLDGIFSPHHTTPCITFPSRTVRDNCVVTSRSFVLDFVCFFFLLLHSLAH